jgi:hypothetical protein
MIRRKGIRNISQRGIASSVCTLLAVALLALFNLAIFCGFLGLPGRISSDSFIVLSEGSRNGSVYIQSCILRNFMYWTCVRMLVLLLCLYGTLRFWFYLGDAMVLR